MEKISTRSIAKILGKKNITLHRQKSQVIAYQKQGEFVEQMNRVLDVYARPYDARYPVICLDESRKQLLDREQFVGTHGVHYHNSTYERKGVKHLYMVFEPLAGQRYVTVTDDQKRDTYTQILVHLLDNEYKEAEKIIVVQDNLNTHGPLGFEKLYGKKPAQKYLSRLIFVNTPPHGSWLNMSEIELSVLKRQCLQYDIADEQTLKIQISAWQKDRNDRHVKANWHFRKEDVEIEPISNSPPA